MGIHQCLLIDVLSHNTSHRVVKSCMGLLRIPKTISFPCLSPFHRPSLEFFPPSANKIVFCFPLFICAPWFPLMSYPKGVSAPSPFFSPRDNTHLLFLQSLVSLFPQPTTKLSRSLFTQAAALSMKRNFQSSLFRT
jgi:hypothetical protein